MRPDTLLKRLRALTCRVKGAIVQDCPPELYACELCGKLDCTNKEWLNCRQRLAAAQFVKFGDRQALSELRQLRIEHEEALRRALPGCSGLERVLSRGSEAEPRSGEEGSGAATS